MNSCLRNEWLPLWLAFPEDLNTKNIYSTGIFSFSFSQHVYWQSSCSSRSARIIDGAPWLSHCCVIFMLPSASSRRSPAWGWPSRSSPWPTHQEWEHCPRWWRSWGNYHHERLVYPDSLLLHLLLKLFGRPTGRLLWELQICGKSGMNRLVNTAWAWASFVTVSCWSFSTSLVILMMEAFAFRFLWSSSAATATCFSSLAFS